MMMMMTTLDQHAPLQKHVSLATRNFVIAMECPSWITSRARGRPFQNESRPMKRWSTVTVNT